MTAIFACSGHLLVDLPLFGGPVLLLIGGVLAMTRSERQRAARPEEPPPVQAALN
jgi:hypothetical protein